jgi:hypothetical protein
MRGTIGVTDHVEPVRVREDDAPLTDAWAKLAAVAGEQRVDGVGHHSTELLQALAGGGLSSFLTHRTGRLRISMSDQC